MNNSEDVRKTVEGFVGISTSNITSGINDIADGKEMYKGLNKIFNIMEQNHKKELRNQSIQLEIKRRNSYMEGIIVGSSAKAVTPIVIVARIYLWNRHQQNKLTEELEVNKKRTRNIKNGLSESIVYYRKAGKWFKHKSNYNC